MNDITKLRLNGKLYIFADDISLIINAKSYNESQLKIDSDLNIISQWLKNNRLVLNYLKSNYILMGNLRVGCIKPSINNKLLNRVFSTKKLGIEIDNNLKFDSHINKLFNQLNSRLCLMSKLKKFLPEYTLNFLYKSLVKPKLDYGCILWGFTHNTHIDFVLIFHTLNSNHRKSSLELSQIHFIWQTVNHCLVD